MSDKSDKKDFDVLGFIDAVTGVMRGAADALEHGAKVIETQKLIIGEGKKVLRKFFPEEAKIIDVLPIGKKEVEK